jgi:hypothetical protein
MYALGEIVLVVLGILIALQINTWNQNRINSAEEKRILASIWSEINVLEWQSISGRDRYIRTIEAADKMISWINEPSMIMSYDSINIELSLLNTRWLLGKGNSTTIYDALTGSGELGLVSSADLRKRLNDHKRDMMLLASYEENQINFVDNHLMPVMAKYIDGVEHSNLRDKYRKDTGQINPAIVDLPIQKGKFEYDYSRMRSDRIFSNYLVQFKKHTVTLIPIYERLIQCIADIEKYAKYEE